MAGPLAGLPMTIQRFDGSQLLDKARFWIVAALAEGKSVIDMFRSDAKPNRPHRRRS
jgi:predicted DNA-binding protein (UPF0251 family)